MNLSEKTTLKLRSDDAQALRRFGIGAVTSPHDSAYYKLVLICCARIAHAITRRTPGKGLI